MSKSDRSYHENWSNISRKRNADRPAGERGASTAKRQRNDDASHSTSKKVLSDNDRPLGYKRLETISEKDPVETVLLCCQNNFLQLLSDKEKLEQKKDWVDLILKSVYPALTVDDSMRSYRDELKNELLSNHLTFFTEVCRSRLENELSVITCASNVEPLMRSLTFYLDIYHRLCSLDQLAHKSLILSLRSILFFLKEDNVCSITSMSTVTKSYEAAVKITTMEIKAANQEKESFKDGRILTDSKPLQSFREIPAHPTINDINAKVRLRKNKTDGGFEDPDDYLDIQFRLFREDYISTIREGVREVRKNPDKARKGRLRSGNCKVYTDFEIGRVELCREGLFYILRLNTNSSGFSGRSWWKSKRLCYGSLICLSPSGFQHDDILFATVAEREPRPERKPASGKRRKLPVTPELTWEQRDNAWRQIKISFIPESQKIYNTLDNLRGPFMVIESSAFYESYSHVLRGLQTFSSEDLPMQRYIVHCEKNIQKPSYLSDNLVYRLPTGDGKTCTELLPISDPSSWLSCEDLRFNQSQYEAYKAALTQEFSVIQGPPGTGKTYVGLRIVETLIGNLYGKGRCHQFAFDRSLERRRSTFLRLSPLCDDDSPPEESQLPLPPIMSRPILVVCYTNHALDQFLEGILEFCDPSSVVRVGSRSRSEKVMECNINKRRLGYLPCAPWALYKVYDRKESLQNRFKNLSLTSTKLNNGELGFYGFEGFPFTLRDPEDINYSCLPSFIESEVFRTQLRKYFKQKRRLCSYLDGLKVWLGAAQWVECGSIYTPDEDDTPCWSGIPQGFYDLEPSDCDTAGDYSYYYHQECGKLAQLQQTAESTKVSKVVTTTGTADSSAKTQQAYNTAAAAAAMCEMESSDADRRVIEGIDPDSDSEGLTVTIDMSSLQPHKALFADGTVMSENEVRQLEVNCKRHFDGGMERNITVDLNYEERWKLYRYWFQKYYQRVHSELMNCQNEFPILLEKERDIKKQNDIMTLRNAKVIGMTTTGAAKMQSVLQQVGPRIVVVEEAAEVLEAHIITALSKGCKHLILIGDHKQLKPSPTVYDLATKYHLDLSLFERMVNNGLPVETLTIQHRMRPEISKFMRHIYDRLDDHKSVQGRESIRGVPKPVFFFNHHEMETEVPGLLSKSNHYEAAMIIEFARYLIRQGYHPTQISIITLYRGQELHIKHETYSHDEFKELKITSVDNFQGEENDIIIVSLVRSNKDDKLGFVKIENRVCVTLSRAKYGMYLFGNFDMLSQNSEIWGKMVSDAKNAGEFCGEIDLSCVEHGKPAVMKDPQDFRKKAPDGGCTNECGKTMPCGHACPRRCHFVSPRGHEQFRCMEPCTRKCPKLHPCNGQCYQCASGCRPCDVPRTETLKCGHKMTAACPRWIDETDSFLALETCDKPCEKKLSCGHVCKNKCSKACEEKCSEKVEKICSKCEEPQKVLCSSDYADFQCTTPCGKTLECGHKCSGTCFTCHFGQHKLCKNICNKRRLACGHICKAYCGNCTKNGQCSHCFMPCKLKCSHSRPCTKRCYENCMFGCSSICRWGCEHSMCKKPCGEKCDYIPCEKRCNKPVFCRKCVKNYSCVGLCGERCPNLCRKCDRPRVEKSLKDLPEYKDMHWGRWLILDDCDHPLPVSYMDKWVGVRKEKSELIVCPYPHCKKLILNTGRYVSKTRQEKYAASTKEQSETVLTSETPTDRASIDEADHNVQLPTLPSYRKQSWKEMIEGPLKRP